MEPAKDSIALLIGFGFVLGFGGQAPVLSGGTVVAWGDNTFGETNSPPALTTAVQVAGGGSHSLALSADGTVVAWGAGAISTGVYPNYGQSSVPSGLSNIVAVAAGGYHSLALTTSGHVVAWGYNQEGETNVPADLTTVVAIGAGTWHSLALKADGTVVAWGDSTAGKTRVPEGLTNAVEIAAGETHNLALRADRTVLAWGDNRYGESTVPAGLSNVTAIAAGYAHNLALKVDGTVVGWGEYFRGGVTVPMAAPAGLTNVVAIAAGGGHSLALKADGTVVAWGADDFGESDPPPSLTQVTAIAAGAGHSLALVGESRPFLVTPLVDRTAIAGTDILLRVVATGTGPMNFQWRFGDTNLPGATNAELVLNDLQLNQAGRYSVVVGNALGATVSRAARLTLVPLMFTSAPESRNPFAGQTLTLEASFVGIGPFHYQWDFNGAVLPGATDATLALTNIPLNQAGDYSIAVSNTYGVATGQVAHVTVSVVASWYLDRNIQSDVPAGLTNVLAISAGGSPNLALNADGSVSDWPALPMAPVPLMSVPGLSHVVAIAAGSGFGLALRENGTVVAWGFNVQGQANVPAGLSNVVAIAAGYQHSLALRQDGIVVAWGENSSGQTTVPPDLTNAVAIAAGSWHNLALRADGTVVAWGAGSVDTRTLTNIVAVAAGQFQSMALRSDGTLYTDTGAVPAGLSHVVAIAAGAWHNLALTADGTVTAWPYYSSSLLPVPAGLTHVVAIAGGGPWYSLALIGSGPPMLKVPVSHPMWNTDGFTVSLPSRSGRVYRLEYKNSLAENGWVALPLVAGNGSTLSLKDPGATGRQRFYRVRQW